jgi:acyl-CoA synthetase (AMP-forming)/AMP-acid ligase II
MDGLMMDRPLMIASLIEHAARYHGDSEIWTRTVEGPVVRARYDEAAARAKRAAKALLRLGIRPGDRVATLAWNTQRHFELYYAISGIGAVCHTINPRLFREQIVYIVEHARDRVLFVDVNLAPLVEALLPQLPGLERVVVMTDATHMPAAPAGALCYEALLAAESDDFEWPEFDERTASSLCYTSGTTGNPKGALYTHRSTVLHTLMVSSADVLGFTSDDVVCPIVPMFHVNAWGIPYAAPMCGARLVMPGAALDGPSLCELFEAAGVTCAVGVPTVWLGLLKRLEEMGRRPETLRRLVIGGSAPPRAMIEAFENRYGIEVVQGWGMTEMSPVGTFGRLKGKHRDLGPAERIDLKAKQGRVIYGTEAKIVGPDGRAAPLDGASQGALLVRGHAVVSAYFGDEAATGEAFDEEGWFRTGDVGTLDADGFLRITDRTKDVIKSGGEWISSIDVENAAMGHPDVAEAAVIGLPHPKWSERPLLVVVPKPGTSPTREDILAYLAPRMARWWLPDDVAFRAELPHTATGKLLKTKLREDFAGHVLPEAGLVPSGGGREPGRAGLG